MKIFSHSNRTNGRAKIVYINLLIQMNQLLSAELFIDDKALFIDDGAMYSF